jgi:hypothetical protein
MRPIQDIIFRSHMCWLKRVCLISGRLWRTGTTARLQSSFQCVLIIYQKLKTWRFLCAEKSQLNVLFIFLSLRRLETRFRRNIPVVIFFCKSCNLKVGSNGFKFQCLLFRHHPGSLSIQHTARVGLFIVKSLVLTWDSTRILLTGKNFMIHVFVIN